MFHFIDERQTYFELIMLPKDVAGAFFCSKRGGRVKIDTPRITSTQQYKHTKYLNVIYHHTIEHYDTIEYYCGQITPWYDGLNEYKHDKEHYRLIQ